MKKTIVDYLTVLFGTGVGRGIAFLNSIIIARMLGPDDFGRFSIFFVVMVLTWIFPQAFDSVFVRYAKTATDQQQKNEFLRVSFFFKLVYSSAALLLAYPIAFILATFCFRKPEMTMLIVSAIVSGVFQAFLMTIASIYQEKEKFNIFAFLYASYTASIFVALLFLRLLSDFFTLQNTIIIHVLISVAIGVVSIYLLFKRKIKHIWPLNSHCLSKSFHLGKWVFWSVVVATLFVRIDTVFLPRYVSFDLIGQYGVAVQLTMIISVMTGALSSVFLPKACAAAVSRSTLACYIKESIILVIPMIIALLVLIVFSSNIIKFLFGSKYLVGYKISQILLFGWIFNIVFMPFGALFYAFDDSRSRFVIDSARLIAAMILLSIFTRTYLLVGAAWSMTTAHLISCVLGFYFLNSKIKKHKWS